MSDPVDAAVLAERLFRRLQGIWAFVIDLYGDRDNERILTSLDALSRHLYWKDKDLSAAVSILEGGIHLGLAYAAIMDGEDRARLRSWAKTFAYNLGSFCWPGWDEPGIKPTQDQVDHGRRTAQLNLDLAIALDKPPVAVARAHWLMSAYAIAEADYEAARSSSEAHRHFEQSGAGGEALVIGYGQLIDALNREAKPGWMARHGRSWQASRMVPG